MSNPGNLSDLKNFATNTANIDDIISLDVSDIGTGLNTRNLDMDLLANQTKRIGSPKTIISAVQSSSSSGNTFHLNSSPASPLKQIDTGIDFINIEDTNKSFSVNTTDSGLSGIDSIHINKGLRPESVPLGLFGSNETTIKTDDNSVSSPLTNEPRMSPEQEITEKNKYLTKIRRLGSKGVVGTPVTMNNSLDDIIAEHNRLVDSAGLEKSIKFQRNLLVTCVTGMEFLNQRFNPVDVNLDGWSESVNESQEDFDEIFEELYDKYKDKTKVAPEIRLLMTLGISASMCHLTNTFFKSKMPGMDEILKRNPDLARQFTQAAAEQTMGPGFANFMSMGSPSPRQEPQPFNNWNEQQPTQSMNTPEPPSPKVQTARREMRGPSGVEDILKAFETEDKGNMTPTGFNPPPRSETEETQSVFTSTTMNGSEAGARKIGRGGRRKPMGAAVGSQIDLIV
jgi:hypothetical protein